MDTLKGQLLVATPMLIDPNFDRTVVWLLDHGDDGALGLVLNRPSQLPVAEPLPAWQPLAGRHAVVFIGGPVATSSVIGLGRRVASPGPELPGGTFQVVQAGVGILDLATDPTTVVGLGAVRCFAGHAGWGPGQLEAEIAEGAWLLVDATPDDPLTDRPEALWRAVLARRPDLARFALVPDDPSSN